MAVVTLHRTRQRRRPWDCSSAVGVPGEHVKLTIARLVGGRRACGAWGRTPRCGRHQRSKLSYAARGIVISHGQPETRHSYVVAQSHQGRVGKGRANELMDGSSSPAIHSRAAGQPPSLTARVVWKPAACLSLDVVG